MLMMADFLLMIDEILGSHICDDGQGGPPAIGQLVHLFFRFMDRWMSTSMLSG